APAGQAAADLAARGAGCQVVRSRARWRGAARGNQAVPGHAGGGALLNWGAGRAFAVRADASARCLCTIGASPPGDAGAVDAAGGAATTITKLGKHQCPRDSPCRTLS